MLAIKVNTILIHKELESEISSKSIDSSKPITVSSQFDSTPMKEPTLETPRRLWDFLSRKGRSSATQNPKLTNWAKNTAQSPMIYERRSRAFLETKMTTGKRYISPKWAKPRRTGGPRGTCSTSSKKLDDQNKSFAKALWQPLKNTPTLKWHKSDKNRFTCNFVRDIFHTFVRHFVILLFSAFNGFFTALLFPNTNCTSGFRIVY